MDLETKKIQDAWELIKKRSQIKTKKLFSLWSGLLFTDKKAMLGDIMDDKDVKEAALKQAQEAYGMFLSFMKWVAYIFIVLVIILAFFNFFDDPTGSKHLPEEISDQYDPSGLSKK